MEQNELTYEDIDTELSDIFGQNVDLAVKEEPEPQETVMHPAEIIMAYVREMVPGIDIDDRGLALPDDVEFQAVQNLAVLFESTHASIPLWWGDLINEAEKRFRQEWTQILSDRIGKAEGTVRNWRFTAAGIPRDIRPDPTVVRISKLYHAASLATTSGKVMVLTLAERESVDTKGIQYLCDLLKTYPEDEREDQEDLWVGVWNRHDLDYGELCVEIRADLIQAGHLEDDTGADEDEGEDQDPQKSGQDTAEDLVAKLMDLAEEAGQNVPQNVLALFASSIGLAKVAAFSQDPDAVQASFSTMGMVMDHLVRLRLAQLESGHTDVGCNCTIDDMGGLAQLTDCPVHGWDEEPEDEDGE